MSFLGGLISSAAKGLQGGAEAVSTIAKAGVEKNMQIDLQRELSEIEFNKSKRLEDLKSTNRKNEYKANKDVDKSLAMDTELRNFNLETMRQEGDIVGKKDQSIIDTNDSARKLNEQKYKTEQLATEVSKTRFDDMKKLYKAYETNDTKAIDTLTKKLTLEDNLIGSASRNKRAEIFMKMGQAIEDVLSTGRFPDDNEKGGDRTRDRLTREMEGYFKKANDLVGNTDAFSSMKTQSGGNTTTNNNNGLVNSQLPPPDSFSPKDVTADNAEQFIGKTFYNPVTKQQEVMTGFDRKTKEVLTKPADQYNPYQSPPKSGKNKSETLKEKRFREADQLREIESDKRSFGNFQEKFSGIPQN